MLIVNRTVVYSCRAPTATKDMAGIRQLSVKYLQVIISHPLLTSFSLSLSYTHFSISLIMVCDTHNDTLLSYHMFDHRLLSVHVSSEKKR